MTLLYALGLVGAAIVGAVVGTWAYIHWLMYQMWRDS